MSRTVASRLVPQWRSAVTVECPFSRMAFSRCLRSFSSTSKRNNEGETPSELKPQSLPSRPAGRNTSSSMASLANLFSGATKQDGRPNRSRTLLDTTTLSSDGSFIQTPNQFDEEPHHFHIYATRHNTHITLTKPNREPIMSMSCGNIGFRKSGRKHYDSAYQLAAYVMGRMQEQGINAQIRRLEVCLRGFGAGREAVTKALLGTEGRFLRGKVIRVTDATRLKFGGTRSKKPRRLG
ncbi:hypothetical protein F5884DRAFT_857715 [Xylogone sp. PMI_703]|nr:hypothetical protein F5884DRAFT_857715 [Xylogone sp. PMI_703]